MSRAQYRHFNENKKDLIAQGVNVDKELEAVNYNELPERSGQPNRKRYGYESLTKAIKNIQKKYHF